MDARRIEVEASQMGWDTANPPQVSRLARLVEQLAGEVAKMQEATQEKATPIPVVSLKEAMDRTAGPFFRCEWDMGAGLQRRDFRTFREAKDFIWQIGAERPYFARVRHIVTDECVYSTSVVPDHA